MDCPEDQNDLFQEITYQLWKFYQLIREKASFLTWMYRVAINTAIVFLKSKKKRDFISTQEDLNFNIKNEDNSEKEYKIKNNV